MSDHRPRLAYVTAGFPFPLTSGYLRHYHLIGGLSTSHRIHLFSLTGPGFRDGDIEGVAPIVEQIHAFPRPPGGSKIRSRFDPGHAGRPTRALSAALEAMIEHDEIDAVLLSGKDTAAVADVALGRVPLVVDLCDASSVRLTQEMTLAGPLRRVGLQVRRRGLRQIEQRLVRAGDALLVASERDRQVLAAGDQHGLAARAVVVPNGIDLGRWTRRTPHLGRAVVFCGNLAYRPNADAARQLVQVVMPHVWARHPDTPVTIVGTGASRSLQHDLTRDLVQLTGEVPDVRPHLEAGAVFVAPLRICSGIQNKLLEALALELPVVTSSVAAAGLSIGGDAAPVTTADDPADAAAAVIRHLDAVDSGQGEPHRAGRAWVRDRFDWGRSSHLVATTIRDTLERADAPC